MTQNLLCKLSFRGCSTAAHIAINAACQLKLQLARILQQQAQQQLQEEEDADVAIQLHGIAVEATNSAAKQLHHTGTSLLRLQAVQQLAKLRLQVRCLRHDGCMCMYKLFMVFSIRCYKQDILRAHALACSTSVDKEEAAFGCQLCIQGCHN